MNNCCSSNLNRHLHICVLLMSASVYEVTSSQDTKDRIKTLTHSVWSVHTNWAKTAIFELFYYSTCIDMERKVKFQLILPNLYHINPKTYINKLFISLFEVYFVVLFMFVLCLVCLFYFLIYPIDRLGFLSYILIQLLQD